MNFLLKAVTELLIIWISVRPYFLKWQIDIGYALFHKEKLKIKTNSLNLDFHMEIINLTFCELPHQQFIFINIHVCMCVLVAQSCLILCDPVDCSLPGSSVHGILQARILEWVAIPFSRGSSWSRDQTWVSCFASRFFTVAWATSDRHKCVYVFICIYTQRIFNCIFSKFFDD